MNTYERTLYFQLGPSRWLAASTAIGHVAAIIIVCWIGTQWPLVFLLLCPVLCSAWMSHIRPTPGWLPPDGRFRWSSDDRLQWQTATGETKSADCLDVERIGTIAIRLRVREVLSRRRRTLLILRDSVAGADHRRLRARATVRGRGRQLDAD